MRGRGRCSARAPAVKLSGRRDGVGLTHPLRGFVELAPFGRSVGSRRCAALAELARFARSVRTHTGRALRTASWELLYGRGVRLRAIPVRSVPVPQRVLNPSPKKRYRSPAVP